MRSVTVLAPVVNLMIVVIEIPTICIVDIPVSVVVDAVPGNFILIDPDGIRQLGMRNFHTRIDQCDYNISLSFPIYFPGFFGTDVNTGHCRGVIREVDEGPVV